MAGSESVTMMILANADVKGGEKPYLFTEAFLKKEKKVVNVQGPMKFEQYLVADKGAWFFTSSYCPNFDRP